MQIAYLDRDTSAESLMRKISLFIDAIISVYGKKKKETRFMVSLLLIFDITVAKSRVYGKQALHDEGRMHEESFVNPYVG